eukprot:13546196-Alexandrium_andersonii.AAC.1
MPSSFSGCLVGNTESCPVKQGQGRAERECRKLHEAARRGCKLLAELLCVCCCTLGAVRAPSRV